MATKKSAKSKGYRKQTGKRPYLSKRDIAVLCVLLAAVAIGAFFLFRYDDGALKVKNGEVVTDGDNWLIVNGSNARGRARYFKLGEMGEIDGYTREKGILATDANVPQYVFTPQGEDSGVASISVTTSHSGTEALAKYATQALASVAGNEVTGDIQTAGLGGQQVTYYLYTSEYASQDAGDGDAAEVEESAEGEDAAEGEKTTEGEDAAEGEDADASEEDRPGRFGKSIAGYIGVGEENCIVIHAESRAESAEACLSDEDMTAILEQAAAAVTLEGAE